MTPAEVSAKEVFIGRTPQFFSAPLNQPKLNSKALENAQVIMIDGRPGYIIKEGKEGIDLWFVKGTDTKTQTKGYFHACLLRHILEKQTRQQKYNDSVSEEFESVWKEMVDKGWKFESVFLGNQVEVEKRG